MDHHPCFILQSQYLLLILVLLLLCVCWATTTAAAVADGQFIFDGFSGADLNLTMEGNASVAQGLLRLTSGRLQKGHAFYPYPLDFTDASNGSSLASFSTTFLFSIMGPYLDLSSHGLAFVLCSNKDFASALPAQYLGLLNSSSNGKETNHIVSIELDTIQSTEFQDIDDNHIGIDINSLSSAASATLTRSYYTSDGALHTLNLISGQPIQVWVDYDSKQTKLNVTVAPCCLSSKLSTPPQLSVIRDLSSVLPTTAVFAGFSAATGIVASRHYILGWSLKINGEPTVLNYSALSIKTIQELAAQLHHQPHTHTNNTIVLCAILLPTLGIAIVVSATLFKLHMKRRLEARRNELEWRREYGPPSFTYKDLSAATGGFKDKMLLGKGGFGTVA